MRQKGKEKNNKDGSMGSQKERMTEQMRSHM